MSHFNIRFCLIFFAACSGSSQEPLEPQHSPSSTSPDTPDSQESLHSLAETFLSTTTPIAERVSLAKRLADAKHQVANLDALVAAYLDACLNPSECRTQPLPMILSSVLAVQDSERFREHLNRRLLAARSNSSSTPAARVVALAAEFSIAPSCVRLLDSLLQSQDNSQSLAPDYSRELARLSSELEEAESELRDAELEPPPPRPQHVQAYIVGYTRGFYEIQIQGQETRSLLLAPNNRFQNKGLVRLHLRERFELPIQLKDEFGGFHQSWKTYVEVGEVFDVDENPTPKAVLSSRVRTLRQARSSAVFEQENNEARLRAIEDGLKLARTGSDSACSTYVTPAQSNEQISSAINNVELPEIGDRTKAAALNRRGLAARRAGSHVKALRWYSSAIEADPSYAWARFNAACELALQGDSKAALHHLLVLKRLDTPDAREALSNASSDDDLQSLHNDPTFRLIAQMPALRPD